MKIEKIGYNKIKITVTLDDMTEWGLSLDSFVGNTQKAQDLFWNMLRRAENETGFSVDNAQLMVEAMPLKNEGVVLFVTRVEEDYADEVERILRVKPRRPRYKVKKLHQSSPKRDMVYGFNNFDDLCGFAKALPNGERQSSIHKKGESYYLSLSLSSGEEKLDIFTAYAGEFGGWQGPSGFGGAFVDEHTEPILASDAIQTIKRYF